MQLNENGLKIAIVGGLALGLLWLLSKQVEATAEPRRSKKPTTIDVEPVEVEPPPAEDPPKDPAPVNV